MKEIVDFPGYYITEEGFVFGANHKPIQGIQRKNGTWTVRLMRDNRRVTMDVDVLVAKTYIDEHAIVVKHNDGNIGNNHVANLSLLGMFCIR